MGGGEIDEHVKVETGVGDPLGEDTIRLVR